MVAKQLPGIYAPDGSLYMTLTNGSGTLVNPTTVTKPLLAVVGDSIMSASIDSNTATKQYDVNRGFQFWAQTLTGQRIYSPQSMNFGVVGDRTDSVLARMTPILTCGAGIYFVMIGTNDISVNSTAVIQANLTNIWTQLLATGAKVIASTILPRTLAQQVNRDQIFTINRWIRSQQYQYHNFFVVDSLAQYGDPAAADFSPKSSPASYSYDGLHPTGYGAYYAAQPLVALLNTLYPPVSSYPGTTNQAFNAHVVATDAFSATNVTGNVLANAILAGTGGTLTGGGGTATGSAATSYTLALSANGGTITSLVATGSKVTGTDGRTGQQIVISGTATGAGSATPDAATGVFFTQDIASPGTVFSAGDVVRAECDITWAASAADIQAIELYTLWTVGGTNYNCASGPAMGDVWTPVAGSGAWRTPDFVVPSGSITLARWSVRVYIKNGAASPALTYTIFGPSFRKVV